MSYYAANDDDDNNSVYQPDNRNRGRSKNQSRDQEDDLIEMARQNSPSPDGILEVNRDDERRERRLKAKQERESKKARSKSRERRLRAKYVGNSDDRNQRFFFSKKKKKDKSRQEKVYDDLYGTDYHEVDDGIVGCADHLCVNREDVLQEFDPNHSLQIDKSPNTGEQNIVHEEEEVYIVKQRYGYFSIIFGVVQIVVLALMMWQCGVAPMNINPMFGPYPDALSEWGGKNSILIVEDGEWWRLITPIFLHAGVIHLFCNVAVQLELGVFFEREWGSMTWLIIYLASAFGSSVLSVITMPDAVSVGSSGAVMGLFGAKLSEVICRCCERSDSKQSQVAHQVRKEQCIGVSCSVVVVMAFSFIPYGESIIFGCEGISIITFFSHKTSWAWTNRIHHQLIGRLI